MNTAIVTSRAPEKDVQLLLLCSSTRKLYCIHLRGHSCCLVTFLTNILSPLITVQLRLNITVRVNVNYRLSRFSLTGSI